MLECDMLQLHTHLPVAVGLRCRSSHESVSAGLPNQALRSQSGKQGHDSNSSPYTTSTARIAPMSAMDPLRCEPAKLPEQEVWFGVLEALSHKSHPDGDWHAYAHLSSRKSFFQPMIIPRVQEVLALLERHKLGSTAMQPRCTLCNNSDDYAQHMGGPKHWSALRDHLPDRVPIRSLEQNFWNVWPIQGGFLRFNELTGAVEMSKGARQPGPPAAVGCGGTLCAAPTAERAHQRQAQGVARCRGLPMPPWEPEAWLSIRLNMIQSASFSSSNQIKETSIYKRRSANLGFCRRNQTSRRSTSSWSSRTRRAADHWAEAVAGPEAEIP